EGLGYGIRLLCRGRVVVGHGCTSPSNSGAREDCHGRVAGAGVFGSPGTVHVEWARPLPGQYAPRGFRRLQPRPPPRPALPWLSPANGHIDVGAELPAGAPTAGCGVAALQIDVDVDTAVVALPAPAELAGDLAEQGVAAVLLERATLPAGRGVGKVGLAQAGG